MIAKRRILGTISRKISTRLPARSVPWSDRPVTLSPGRPRLATRPAPTGSPAAANTIGRDSVTLDPAAFAQSLHKGGDPTAVERRCIRAQETDGRPRARLLCARRERPCRCAAEKRDELAAFELSAHSITSSARASSIDGISRPSALAVLRLITDSYLVGACTGRSAGFSPLRTRST